MEQIPIQESFDREKSPIREAYVLLNASTPLELSLSFTREDQRLIKEKLWDYRNPDLITNQIKDMLEIHIFELSGEEKDWAQEILWFWYHHATSTAFNIFQDREQAQAFCAKALEFLPEDNPNKITKLMSLLIQDRVQEAEIWAEEIIDDDHDTAYGMVSDYKNFGTL